MPVGTIVIVVAIQSAYAGIWKHNQQLDLEYTVFGTSGIGAQWLGNDDPLGHAFWQDIDSEAISAVAAGGLKYPFAHIGQSDVLVGWMLGAGVGYLTGTLTVPLIVSIPPRGTTIVISKHF